MEKREKGIWVTWSSSFGFVCVCCYIALALEERSVAFCCVEVLASWLVGLRADRCVATFRRWNGQV
jgi:hypothetical protein